MSNQRSKKQQNAAEQKALAEVKRAENELKRSTRSARKKVIKKQMPGIQRVENPYLQTLVDPERFSGVRYPDSFPRLTGTCQGLINNDMYVFPTAAAPSTDVQLEPAGTFLNIVSPVMLDPILEYRETAISGTGGADPDVTARMILTTPSELYGFVSLDEDVSTLQTDSNQLFLKATGTVNVKAPFMFSDQDFAQPMNRGFDPNGKVFYGYPFRWQNTGAGFVEVKINYCPGAAAAPSTVIFAQLVSTLGIVEVAFTTTIATGSNLTEGIATFTNVNLNTLGVTGANSSGCGLPGIGLRIRTAAAQVNGSGPNVSAVYVRWVRGTVPKTPRFEPIKFPDEGIYTQSVDEYRVVSSSTWVEYQGADLTNGGQIAAIMYRGGRQATETGFWNYDLVAETPGGYQGPLKTGTYSFWMPSNQRDMLFRSLDTSERWALPYVVNVGLVASPDLPHTLRLRVPMNFEFVSTSQFYQYDYAVVDPQCIAHAAQVVAKMKTSMENPLHWKAIKDYLAKAASTAMDVGRWVKQNWGVIAPAATAIGSALI